ncbi:MAG: hypothetical protein P1U54_05090 [Immundisolibacteraceae bacterium]|nr:hypothetical protein [Immundisolibacteraceae bacterium]
MTKDTPFTEPMRLWREWVQTSEKQWSEAMTGMMADEHSGKAFGQYFQEWLHAQNMFTEMIGQQLASMNLPSRVDVISIKDRLGEVDDTLSGLAAEIHQLKKQLAESAINQAAPASKARPARTRKPAAKSAPKSAPKKPGSEQG